jgi:hypothetical protein
MLLKRLTEHARLTIGFACIGAATVHGAGMLRWLDIYERNGWDVVAHRMPREFAAFLLGALILMFGLKLCTHGFGNLQRRPWKFLASLAVVSALASVAGWCAIVAMSGGRLPLDAGMEKFYDIWVKAMLWGGMVGWMYLLSLQRAESHARLSSMLVQRVVLARQLARSRLGTARAQFDPAMVARVLSQVHQRYRHDPVGASGLLDELISYLRLAMNRARVEVPDEAADQALHAALTALQRAAVAQGEKNVA